MELLMVHEAEDEGGEAMSKATLEEEWKVRGTAHPRMIE